MKYITSLFLTWMYLVSFTQETILSLPLKHSDLLVNLKFTPQRNYLYTVSKDLQIRLWYVFDNRTIRIFTGPQSEITDFVALSDNSRLFASDKSGTLFQWNCQNSEIITKLKATASITTLCLNETKQYLLAGQTDGKIIFYQLPNLQPIKTIETYPYYPVKILKAKEPDRYYIGFCKIENDKNNLTRLEKGNVQLYDDNENKFFPISSNSENISLIAFSPDSNKLMAVSSEIKIIRIFDTNKLIEETTIKTPFKPSVVFASRTNKMIGVGFAENNFIKVFRYSGEEIISFTIDSGNVVYGEFNYDITRLHLASSYGFFKIYDFQATIRDSIGHYVSYYPKVTTSAYHPLTKWLALSFTNGQSLLFDLKTNKIDMINDSFYTRVETMYFDTSSNLLVYYYQPYYKYSENNPYIPEIFSKLTVYDPINKTIVYTYYTESEYITSIKLNNKILYIGYNSGKIDIFDIQQHKTILTSQVAPYDITGIYPITNNKIWIQCIDQKIYQFEISDKLQLNLTQNISLQPNEKLLHISDQQVITNQRMIDLRTSKQLSKVAEKIVPLSHDEYLTYLNHTLTLHDSTKVKWEIQPTIPYVNEIHADTANQFIMLVNQYGEVNFYKKSDGSYIGTLKILPDESWIYTSNLHYDGTPSLINQIKIIKGILYLRSEQPEKFKEPHLLQQTLGIKYQ